MRARWTMVLALAAIGVLIALPAGAQTEVDDPADRVLVHGYDPQAMQLLWSTMLGDSQTVEEECNVTEGLYTYEVGEEGAVSITPTVEEGEDEADPVELGDCTFNQTDVEGPQGQVNHGTVVSNFVQALKDEGYTGGLGCYVRVIAQSDYGQGDQQVRTSDIDEDAEPVDKTGGEVDLTITETTCNGAGEDGEAATTSGRPEDAGPPAHAGPPEEAGPPAHAGAPENAGPPEEAGPPENAGPPEHAGPGGRGG